MKKILTLAIFVSVIYFIAGLVTLKDYGISWDEPTHFKRGQAYLHYFLTGKKTYDNLEVKHRSYYQNDIQNGEFWFKDTYGHPPVNDVLASLSNYVFYQRFGLLGDIESYHLFNIITASLAVFIVIIFAGELFGTLPAVVSASVLALYPLFWSESHFNIKDPSQTAFFSASIYLFYKIINSKKRDLWIILFFISLGISLGIKLNAIFIPLIVLPYLIFNAKKGTLMLSKRNIGMIFVGITLMILIFVGFWPALWQQFPESLVNVFSFYKDVGTVVKYQTDNYYFFGFNTYPLTWIIYTTPIMSILLFVVGMFYSIRNIKEKNGIFLLFLCWLAIPIIRVSIPGVSIYGGVRQIMEYIPALAILCGVGTYYLIKIFRNKFKNTIPINIGISLVILSALIYPLIKYHPNENVYFNLLVGGLNGANEKNIPSSGNSYGNAYKNGIEWINVNAPEGSKLTLLEGELINAPAIWLRKDIEYRKEYFSGVNQSGEYILELIYRNSNSPYGYRWEYVNKFLKPVYEYKVDDTVILKIWKNDPANTYKDMIIFEKSFWNFKYYKEEGNLIVSFGEKINISKLLFHCINLKTASVYSSLDGIVWVKEKDIIPGMQIRYQINYLNGFVNYYFAGREAKFIKISFDEGIDCLNSISGLKTMIFENIP